MFENAFQKTFDSNIKKKANDAWRFQYSKKYEWMRVQAY